MQFSVAQTMLYTTYCSLIALAASLGEYGISAIPALLCLHFFLWPIYMDLDKPCPRLLKVRFHFPFWFIASLIGAPGFLYEFGLWRIPFSGVIIIFLVPSLLVVIQLIKFVDPMQPNIWLRAIQLYLAWTAIGSNLLATCFGTIMPLV